MAANAWHQWTGSGAAALLPGALLTAVCTKHRTAMPLPASSQRETQAWDLIIAVLTASAASARLLLPCS